MNRSEKEIERWKQVRETYASKAEFDIRLASYKAGLVIGRDFGELTTEYLERIGLTEFWDYNFNE